MQRDETLLREIFKAADIEIPRLTEFLRLQLSRNEP
jgi:hypothetical protein